MNQNSSLAPISEQDYQNILYRMMALKLPGLKAVAKSLSIAQSGRKADVQDRIRRYLQIGKDNGDRVRLDAISQILDEAAYGNQVSQYDVLYMEMSNSRGISRQGSNLESSQGPLRPQGQVMPQVKKPWLFFYENPFFVLKKLVTPNAGYCVKAPAGRGTCNLSFQINEADAKLIAQGNTYKLFLLCGAYDKNKPTNDAFIEFPQPLEIHFNGTLVKDNVKGLKNKPGSAKPANLTPYLRPAGRINELKVIYAFSKTDYLLFCYLVEEITPEKLLLKVLGNPHVTKQTTLNEFNADDQDEDDIQETCTRLSLKCPLSFTRMKYPVKSIYCKHLQCFDALSFLHLQVQGATWMCPICNHPVKVKELCISDYVMEIINKTPSNVESAEIGTDGSWVPIHEDSDSDSDSDGDGPVKTERGVSKPLSKTPNPEVVILLDTDEEEDEPVQQTQPTQPEQPLQARQYPTVSDEQQQRSLEQQPSQKPSQQQTTQTQPLQQQAQQQAQTQPFSAISDQQPVHIQHNPEQQGFLVDHQPEQQHIPQHPFPNPPNDQRFVAYQPQGPPYSHVQAHSAMHHIPTQYYAPPPHGAAAYTPSQNQENPQLHPTRNSSVSSNGSAPFPAASPILSQVPPTLLNNQHQSMPPDAPQNHQGPCPAQYQYVSLSRTSLSHPSMQQKRHPVSYRPPTEATPTTVHENTHTGATNLPELHRVQEPNTQPNLNQHTDIAQSQTTTTSQPPTQPQPSQQQPALAPKFTVLPPPPPPHSINQSPRSSLFDATARPRPGDSGRISRTMSNPITSAQSDLKKRLDIHNPSLSRSNTVGSIPRGNEEALNRIKELSIALSLKSSQNSRSSSAGLSNGSTRSTTSDAVVAEKLGSMPTSSTPFMNEAHDDVNDDIDQRKPSTSASLHVPNWSQNNLLRPQNSTRKPSLNEPTMSTDKKELGDTAAVETDSAANTSPTSSSAPNTATNASMGLLGISPKVLEVFTGPNPQTSDQPATTAVNANNEESRKRPLNPVLDAVANKKPTPDVEVIDLTSDD